MKTMIFILTLVFSFSAHAGQTLLHSLVTSPKADLQCTVSIVVDYDAAEIFVVRLEAPGQKYDINNFQKRPKFYSHYSRRYPLNQLFPRMDLHQIKTLNAKISFEKGQTLELVSTLFEGQKFRAQRDISDFFRPAEKSCLLKLH